MNNKNDVNPNMYGRADFENYWGEKLVSVEIIHYMADLLDLYPVSSVYKKLNNVDANAKITNAISFTYSLGSSLLLDYWKVKIITESGNTYCSNSLRCSIGYEDNGKVILGVNGESERLYISMKSGNCSKSMSKC